MGTLLRFLNHPIRLSPAGPRARRVLAVLPAGWVALHTADWATTAAVLAPGGSHEDNPLQAALLAHGGLLALAGDTVLVVAGGAALTWLGYRLWPRVVVTVIGMCGCS